MEDKIKRNHVYVGSCLTTLRTLPTESVDMCITSPPYWNLRNYGTPPEIWGGDSSCDHQWSSNLKFKGNVFTDSKWNALKDRSGELGWSSGQFCEKCGAWKGELGMEPLPQLYIEHMVEIFHEMKRVLKKDGTCWVNLGDTYSSVSGGFGNTKYKGMHARSDGLDEATDFHRPSPKETGFKDKDMLGIPWMFAFAMRDDGWYLRQDIIWAKATSGDFRRGTAMPESIKDRCSKSHEYLFMFAKSRMYYFDQYAIKEKSCDDNEEDTLANRRSVWFVKTKPYKEAHFAVYPPHLIEPAIKAGCPEKVCAKCGKPYVRKLELIKKADRPVSVVKKMSGNGITRTTDALKDLTKSTFNKYKDLGVQPTCDCEPESLPGIVIDPFFGSGTTGEVAISQNKHYVGLEINEKYTEISDRRTTGVKPKLF